MLDKTKPRLRLVVSDTSTVTPLVEKVALYTAEISARREQLITELNQFEAKIADLGQLDPHDFTGLSAIYTKHAGHIRHLLAQFDNGEDVAS